MFSHFGPVAEVDELCRLAVSRLQKWAGLVRGAMAGSDDLDRITEILTAGTASEWGGSPRGVEDSDRYEILSSMRMNAAGLLRYWQERDESS
jgi:hypothetical protein